ncbi:MAG: Trp biosynthesis-associated membrane protein, partial [Mycobacteriales bacterium]
QLTIDAVRSAVAGSRLVPGAQALGYVGLAGVLALAATRRLGRVLVGVLVLAAGVGVVVVVARALADGLQQRGLRELSGCRAAGCTDVVTSPGWAWLAVAGGLLLVASGALVAVRGRGWAALSSSYQPPAARAEQAPVTDKGVWDALDRGEDPTA